MKLASMPFTTTRRVNLDTLIHIHESRPASKLHDKAWEWLSEAEVFHFDGDALIVPSATWDGTTYRATPTTCTCRRGSAPCWHKESAATVAQAMREDEWVDLCESYESVAVALKERQRADITRRTMARERYERSLADVAELFS